MFHASFHRPLFASICACQTPFISSIWLKPPFTQVLAKLPHLASCSLKGSPLAGTERYQQQILQLLPSLQILDGHKIGLTQMRAQGGIGKTLEAESRRLTEKVKGSAELGKSGPEASTSEIPSEPPGEEEKGTAELGRVDTKKTSKRIADAHEGEELSDPQTDVWAGRALLIWRGCQCKCQLFSSCHLRVCIASG